METDFDLRRGKRACNKANIFYGRVKYTYSDGDRTLVIVNRFYK
jgi:hypothetical protein